MTFIRCIDPVDAEGKLKSLYAKVAAPDGEVDQILKAHSLRPHTLEGHMALYKAVLHHTANSIPKWLLETIGVQVSLLNQCEYCVVHHWHGLKRLCSEADNIVAWLKSDQVTAPGTITPGMQVLLAYTEKLTRHPHAIASQDVERCRSAGWTDGQVLEANQVAAYFAYANRTVLGLGVKPVEQSLGLSPSGDSWQHG